MACSDRSSEGSWCTYSGIVKAKCRLSRLMGRQSAVQRRATSTANLARGELGKNITGEGEPLLADRGDDDDDCLAAGIFLDRNLRRIKWPFPFPFKCL